MKMEDVCSIESLALMNNKMIPLTQISSLYIKKNPITMMKSSSPPPSNYISNIIVHLSTKRTILKVTQEASFKFLIILTQELGSLGTAPPHTYIFPPDKGRLAVCAQHCSC